MKTPDLSKKTIAIPATDGFKRGELRNPDDLPAIYAKALGEFSEGIHALQRA